MKNFLDQVSSEKNNYESLFYFIQEAALIGTWEYFINTKELWWSDVTKKIHDVPNGYLPNIDTALDYYKDGESKSTITKKFSNAVELGEHYDVELEIVSFTGVNKWVRAIGHPIFKDDKCVKVNGLFQDITESKISQLKIRSLLKTTKKQNKRLLNFAHIISHNLRSNSGNFSILLDLLQEEFSEFKDNEYFPLLVKASENLNETIDDLSEVVVINTNLNKTYSTVNILDTIKECTDKLSDLISSNDAEIINTIDPTLEVKIIPSYFKSIITHLITNALKFKKEAINPIIEISSELQKKYIVLHFKDNGLGIDLKLHKNNIFGMYKTFHRHEDSKGFGLFLSKNHIEAMNGKIKVKSKVNQGSTFSIYLSI